MKIRNIQTSLGLLSFKNLSQADLILLPLWKHGVVFGPLYVIEIKPMVYSISLRNPTLFPHDFVVHINCKSFDLVKLCNYFKNNYFKFTDFFSILSRFPQIYIIRYVFESVPFEK